MIRIGERKIRMLFDMKDVVYDKEWMSGQKNIPLYYMYRDVSFSESDARRIKAYHLRYDITVIPPRNLGIEYVKTYGHYHPLASAGLTYPEVYEVIEGEADYLLQKRDDDKIIDVVVIKAKKGDKVLIPPNYGHVTINPSNKRLKMANLVSRDFSSVYEPIKEKGGAAYFELTSGFTWNENYEDLPEIRFIESTFDAPGNIYDLIDEPNKLAYLVDPSKMDQPSFDGIL
jgi:glucose-6-phosphate isomerase